MSGLVEEGRAKVNLTLRVVGRRTDGYHDLESVVAFADCADKLTLTPGPELTLETVGPLATACGELSDTLVLKAARLLPSPDADPDEVAGGVVGGMNFTWCGQSCGSTSRAFIHDRIYDAVLARVREFEAGAPPSDDIAALAVRRLP